MEDWNKMQELKNENNRIIEALAEYTEIADGDRSVAMKFLIKTYGKEKVGKIYPETLPPEENTT